MVAGAAAAIKSSEPTTVYVAPTPGVYVAPAPVVVTAPVMVPSPAARLVPVGTTVTVLPAGFVSLNVNGAEYYQCGPTWYQMRVGSNGVYFVVVPAP